jgi:site-specific DNA-cytosine methylase
MNNHEFTVLSPFCGLGAGILGFQRASVDLLGHSFRFRSIGGIDVDATACKDFERLTQSPALCADIAKLTPSELRAFAGETAPDAVISSPPCIGFSGLLSESKSKDEHYQELNRLVLTWVKLMLATWADPPALVLIENVPRIETRGKLLLAEVRRLLGAVGYVFHSSSHDCGELGGLAQHRTRFLLVARLPRKCDSLLYQPIKKRVRGVGEVLERLPLPEDPSGGPMHKIPRISLLNWMRLALIRPGHDWRDLERTDGRTPFNNVFVLKRWSDPVGAVTAGITPTSGGQAVADVRLQSTFPHVYGVLRWSQPSHAITGNTGTPGGGPFSVADIRVQCFNQGYGVGAWDQPSGTVTGNSSVGTGTFSVADPRALPFEPAPTTWEASDVRAFPPWPLVLPTEDGSWHRPLTTLELAVLQGLPATVDGEPLVLSGTNTEQRKHIGNAIPVGAAEAIARQMLLSLGSSRIGSFCLSSDPVWTRPRREALQ